MPTFYVSQQWTLCPQHWRKYLSLRVLEFMWYCHHWTACPTAAEHYNTARREKQHACLRQGNALHTTPPSMQIVWTKAVCVLTGIKVASLPATGMMFKDDGGPSGDGYAKFPCCAATLAPLTVPLNDAVNGIFHQKALHLSSLLALLFPGVPGLTGCPSAGRAQQSAQWPLQPPPGSDVCSPSYAAHLLLRLPARH